MFPPILVIDYAQQSLSSVCIMTKVAVLKCKKLFLVFAPLMFVQFGKIRRVKVLQGFTMKCQK